MANEREPEMPSPASGSAADVEDRVDAVAEAFLGALRGGDDVTAERVVAEHADLPAAVLRARLRVVELMHEAASASRASGASRAMVSGAELRCPHCHSPYSPDGELSGPARCSSCGSSFNILADPRLPGGELAIPERIGRFVLRDVLGRGAFGVVYRATDEELGREVTVKVPRAGAFTSAEDEARFLREARSAASLAHPSVVRVHEVTEHRGLPCIVREFIDGCTLRQRIAEQPPTFRETAALVIAVADALAYAHERGVVHRDIKPDNVLVDAAGRPHVTDFGLARRDEGELTMTLDGQILGTPAYMSPEQAAGRHDLVDARSDVYSLGVVLYELLTGERPFSGQRSMVIHQVIHDDPRPLRTLNEHIPRDLETVCLKAMAKEAQRRYGSASELAADLRRFLEGRPIVARPVGAVEKLWRWCKRSPALSSTILASAMLVIGGLVAFILVQRAHQEELREEIVQKDEALVREEGLRLTTLSSLVLPENPAQALLVAIEGAQRSPGRLSDDALRASLAAVREERTLIGAGSTVRDVRFSRDGRRVIGVSQDVLVWDATTGENELRLLEDGYGINSVDTSPDGSKLVTSSWDMRARIWDAVTGDLLASLRSKNVVDCASFSPDGSRVLTCARDGSARIFNARSGEESASFLHGVAFEHGVFSPDGSRVALACLDGSAWVWTIRDDIRTVLDGHTSWVVDVAFSPAGDRVATASLDGTARVWDAGTARELMVLGGHERSVTRALFSPDGARILTASADHTARLFDASSGAALAVLRGHTDELTDARFSPDGRCALTASEDSTARLWDVATGAQLAVLAGHEGPVLAARFSPDGSRVVTCSFDETVRIWNASVDRDRLAATRRPDWGRQAVFDASGERVLTVTRGTTAEIFDVASGERHVTLDGHEGRIQAVGFDSEGDRAVTAASDDTARVWDAASGSLERVLRGHGSWVQFASFSPDGQLVATASRDSTARIWSAESGEELRRLQHQSWVNAAHFSPDGGRVVTLANDQTAVIWDVATGAKLKTLTHYPVDLLRAAFSHDGRWLVIAAADNRAFLWDTESGERRATLEGHRGVFTDAVFDARGIRMATLFRDGTARVWSVPEATLLATIRAPGAEFAKARFTDDGATLLTTAFDGTRRSWALDPLLVALERRPRELLPDECDVLRVGDETARAEYRERFEERLSRQRVEIAERMWDRLPGSERLRWQLLTVIDRESSRLERHEIVAALERALERTRGMDARIADILAGLYFKAGRGSGAVRFIERGFALPGGAASFERLLARSHELMRPDLATCASVDTALRSLDSVPIIAAGAEWRLLRGATDPGSEWASLEFDDGAWESLPSDFGFVTGDMRKPRTVLADMRRGYTTFYVRRRFTVEDPSAWRRFVLSLKADDGGIAYLNGIEIVRIRVDMALEDVPFDTIANGGPFDPVMPVEIELPPALLRRGDNVLAVRCIASRLGGTDATLLPVLVAERRRDAARDHKLLRDFRAAAGGDDVALRTRYLEARLLMRDGRFAQAAAALDALVASGVPELVSCRLVEALRGAGELSRAEALLASLIEAPDGLESLPVERVDPLSLFQSARWRLLTGARDLWSSLLAFREARAAARVGVLNRSFLVRLALAQYRLGLRDESLESLERSDVLGLAVLKEPLADCVLVRALVLHAKGDEAKAHDELDAALRLIETSQSNSFNEPTLLDEARRAIAGGAP